MKYYYVVTMTQNITLGAFTVFFMSMGKGIIAFPLALIISTTISSLVGLYKVKKFLIFTKKIKNGISILKTLVLFGSKVTATNIMNILSYQVDILMIGALLNSNEVGYYSVPWVLIRTLWLFPQAVQMITFPLTAKYWARNKRTQLRKMLEISIKQTASILIFLSLAMAFFIKDIIELLFGLSFQHSVSPFYILLPGSIFIGTYKAIGGTLAGLNKPTTSLYITTSGVIMNVAMNIYLIPRYGIVGAAMSTSTSFIFISLCSFYYIEKNIHVRLPASWLLPLASSAFLSVLLLLLLSPHLSPLLARLISLGCLCVMINVTVLKKENWITLITSLLR